MNRRELFTTVTGGACTPSSMRSVADVIPNALLLTHDGERVRLYDDLIRGKQVIINMMYTNCTAFCPAITMHMAQVHRALGDRMGRDLFMYSITLKPEEDDPATLAAFAEMHGALLPGWTFLTGNAYDIESIRYAFFRHDHIKIDLDLDVHTARLRIINDAHDRWLHVATLADVSTVLQHISWADPPKSLEERRKENQRLQELIDEEVERYGYRKVI
jgi:protein SCO1